MSVYYAYDNSPSLSHHGTKGMHWGVRRYQNPDGTLTEEGKKRYYKETRRDVMNTYKIVGSGSKLSKKRKKEGKSFGKIPGNEKNVLDDMTSFYRSKIEQLNNGDKEFDRYGYKSDNLTYKKATGSVIREFADTSLSYLESSGLNKDQMLSGKAYIESKLSEFNRLTSKGGW